MTQVLSSCVPWPHGLFLCDSRLEKPSRRPLGSDPQAGVAEDRGEIKDFKLRA